LTDQHAFRAMGTTVTLMGPACPAFPPAARSVEAVFAREEQRFSRFRGDSELTRVNTAAGAWTKVSPAFEGLIRFALVKAAETDGAFDPTVLDAVIAAGYDRTFDEILAGARGVLHPARPCGRWREIDIREGAIRLPEGVGLDLGGVAKGHTADLAASEAIASGMDWALVNAGGDLRIVGEAPELRVAVEDPDDRSQTLAELHLREGALASSSVRSRAWGEDLHHVIDPRTGAPARSDAIQATVWAPTCAEAEVLATWALISGREAASELPCAIVTQDGEVLVSFSTEAAA
jgi:thiamine biosynthesis lipoprotein